MPKGIEISVVLAAYALGCLNAGYYLVRWRLRKDVRQLGTGTAGARNVGRVLGPRAGIAAFALDFAKGAAAVGAARALGVPEPWLAAVMFAVTAGHVWPAQLRFRGGKGASTAGGAMVTFTPWCVPAVVAVALVAWPFVRRITPAGITGFVLSPLVLWLWRPPGVDGEVAAAFVPVVALVAFAHRSNLGGDSSRRIGGPSEAQSGDER